MTTPCGIHVCGDIAPREHWEKSVGSMSISFSYTLVVDLIQDISEIIGIIRFLIYANFTGD